MKSDSSQTPLRADDLNQGGFNVKKIFQEAIRFWYLYLLSLLICVGYAWFKIHYATPMYRVFGQVLVQSDKNGGGSAQALNGGGMDISNLFSNTTNMQNEIAILQTPDLCRTVVDAQKLNISYYNEGDIRRVELYDGTPILVFYHPDHNIVHPVTMLLSFDNEPDANHFRISIGKTDIAGRFFDTLHFNGGSYYFAKKVPYIGPKLKYTISIQDPNATAASIASNLTASLLGTKSTILNLTYNTNIPRKGENVLKGIIQAYINRNLDYKNVTSDSTLQFINGRIALVGGDLNHIENTIQTFREQNHIADIDAQATQLVTNGNSYYQKLNDLDVQLQVLRTMLVYIQDENNNSRPIPSLLNSDGTFTSLTGSYNSMQVDRDKILLTLKADNPLVANMNTQLAGIRSDMIKSLQSQQKALLISRNDLVNQNTIINDQIKKLPSQQRQYLDYSREQDLRQALFLYLLQKREEVAIAKAANSSNVSIISAAKAYGVPYEPVTTTFYTIGVLLGLLLPTVFVVSKVLLNNKVMSRDDVTGATPATILSEIGHNKTAGLLNLSEEGRSMIAEQFRIFRTNLNFTLGAAKCPVIMITSTMSGEGKSFIAANLGQIYAISGKKVLLMELDLRKPKLSEALSLSNQNGFSNYIVSNSPVETFIQPVPLVSGNLHILSSGPVPPNPSELLLSSKTADMMEELKSLYDIIIIDTAPFGAVTDAQILSSFANVTLYILRQGYTTKNSFGIINDILLNNKIQSLYVVINDITGGSSYKYGYGYRYGYGYGYSYQESDKSERRKWWNRKIK